MTTTLETPNLTLFNESIEDARAKIELMSADDRAELSAEWLALLQSADTDSPWITGFIIVRKNDGNEVGQCGFKGPPTSDGTVEIAYGIATEMQGRGYATEAARALTSFAFQHKEVQLVLAHTLPEQNASTRILTKCGFDHVGEIIDPEDGLVWRWEKRREST